jgi:phage baseplate assembly protein V
MKAAFRRLERSVNNLLARIVVTGLNTASKCQMLQVSILADEQKENVEHLEPYGFTSAPLTGAEGFALFPDGDRSHGVILMVSDRRYRIKGLQGGEVCLFTDEGDTLTFKRGNTVELKTKTYNVIADDAVNIKTKAFTLDASETTDISTKVFTLNASDSATTTTNIYSLTANQSATVITAPEISLNGNLTVSDVGGGAAANSVIRGNFKIEGDQTITGTSEAVDHVSSGKSGATHIHNGDSGGETGEPI